MQETAATIIAISLLLSSFVLCAMVSSVLPSLVEQFRQIVGAQSVLSAHAEMVVYECDRFTIEKNCPDVVVFPRTTEHIAAIVQLCNRHGVPFLPRGAGTSLAGGCLPVG